MRHVSPVHHAALWVYTSVVLLSFFLVLMAVVM